MSSVYRHELSLHFHSLTAYVFAAALLLFVGLGVTVVNLEYEWATFEYALAQSLLFLAFVFPILTMRTFAEEHHQKTDQLLYSLPISTTETVLGKFLALLTIFLIPTLIIGTYPLILRQYGNVFMPASYGTLAAFFVMGAAFIAIGMFMPVRTIALSRRFLSLSTSSAFVIGEPPRISQSRITSSCSGLIGATRARKFSWNWSALMSARRFVQSTSSFGPVIMNTADRRPGANSP
jgi:ABC-type transport system involved in multi-copper enzyme maturation permease subunit